MENESYNESLQRLIEEAQENQEDNSEIVDELIEQAEEETKGEQIANIWSDAQAKQIYARTTEGDVLVASDYLDVVRVIKNLDTQKVRLVLHHMSSYCNREITIELSSLKKTQLFTKLTSNGVVVYERCIGVLSEYLMELVDIFIKQGNILYQHEQLGWSDALDKSKGFFAANSIGAPYPSIIRGNDEYKLGQYGDRTVYDDMIQKEVIPNKSLHLPFVLAFTGPIVPLMYGKSACPVLMVNYAGKSSLGKTTSLALMASVWGRGIIDNDRLSVIKTFASTQNGFEAAVNSNNGVPILFDDYEAASQGLTFGSLIYTLAQGESKIRCDKFGHARDTFKWRTTIALTGESSIFDRAGHNLGLKPRIVEFKNKAWTVSKANSIAITSVVGTNYGFYGEEFVRGLLPLTQADLDLRYDNNSKVIESMLPSSDNISDRIQTRLALIRMTAELVRELLDLDIDVDYITDFLVDNEKARQASLDIYEEAKEKLTGYITSNLPRFVRTDKQCEVSTLPNSYIVGRIYGGSKGYMVAILPDAFKTIISEFNDKDAILEHWRDEGFLIVDADRKRFTKKVKITTQTVPTRCYVFLFEDVEELQKYLNDSDTIVPQDLDNEDREKKLNGLSGKAPKETYFRGYKYVLAVPDDKNEVKEIQGHLPHDYPETYHSSPAPESQEPKVVETNYDDSEAIDNTFKDKEDGNND